MTRATLRDPLSSLQAGLRTYEWPQGAKRITFPHNVQWHSYPRYSITVAGAVPVSHRLPVSSD
jgi:hypothetical protein